MANEFKIKHGFTSTGSGTIDGTLDVSTGINVNGAAVATQSWVSGQGFATSGSVSGNYLALSGGTLTGLVTAGAGLNIEDSSTNLSQKNSAGQLKITTAHGYINIGPANSSWAHFETDRGQFYFNERAEIAGEFVPYTGSTHNLGTSSKPWLAVYADNLNISNWDTAYSWGNHASAGYLTSYTETDTLASVTARGSVTTAAVQVNKLQLDSADNYIDTISGYLHLASQGNELVIGGSSSSMYVNYRASTEGTPTDWYWRAGSSSSWSNHSFGNISANGTISATGVITATGGNSTNWNTAYNWGDHSAAGYATASHNHDSRYYTESEIDTKLAAKADTSHKYHRFNNGDEYYDSYGQDNYLRMFTETATFDTFRFRSYSNVEYWDGSTWQAWGANLDTLFDGREDTGFNLDHTHSHFRFEINRSSGWPTMALFVIQSSWTDTNSHTCEVTLETWDGAAWVIKDQWVYSDFQRGINLHATNQTHDGISSMRVTLNTDWVDASHDYYPMRRILLLSNFSGGETLDPWSWNYNKVVNFDALPQAAGANLATQSWVSSQGYVTSLSGYATESYVNTAVSNLVDSAPGALDTLNELAAALGDDPNFAGTITTNLASKVSWEYNDASIDVNDVNKNRGVFSINGTNATTPNRPQNYNTVYTFGGGSNNTLQLGTGSDYNDAGLWVRQYNYNASSPQGIGWQNWATVWTSNDFSNNSSNWDTAYGWGNHASAGYLTSVPSEYLTQTEGDARYYTESEVDGLIEAHTGWQTGSDFVNGTLVRTSIDASEQNGDSFILRVVGKSYSTTHSPFDMILQGYIYNNTFINYSAIVNSTDALGNIRILELDGQLCFWWARFSYWNSFEIYVTSVSGGDTTPQNRVIAVEDVVEPASTLGKKVTVTPYESWTTKEFSQSSVNNWNTAYGWGNHASAGYAASSHNHDGVYLKLSGTTTGLNMNNQNITNVNSISIGDPGPGEGISFGGTWSIWNSPDDLTTNTGGNLQFVNNGTRAMTLDTSNDLYVDGDKVATEAWVASQGYITSSGANYYVDGLSFDTGTGVLTASVNGTTNQTVDLDGRYALSSHSHSYLPLSGGTLTGALVTPRLSITNDTGNNVNSRITVYESGSTSYGMMLWNHNGTSGDWSTMIYGPNQSNRRISFGKANANFPGGKDSVDELAWIDLDNGSFFADGNIYPNGSLTEYVSTGRISNWNTAYSWGNHASAGYLTSIPAEYLTEGEGDARYQPIGTYNTIIGTDSDINTSGATIIDNIYVTDGVITSMGTRVLTQADLGIPTNASGNWWNGGYAAVGTDGVMEVGKYIDFHDTDTQTSDYSYRITNTGGRLYFSGDLELDGGDLYLNDGNTRLHEAGGNALRVTTDSGFIEMGPMNTSHCHIQTDRSNFYFNTEIRVDTGIIGSYNEDLQLRRSGTTKITVGSSLTTFANHISVPQPDAPIFSAANIVGETIEVVFDQSPTSGVDYYQVWSSVAGGAYGMIAQIPTQDIAATMTAVDADFSRSGTHAYRIYAVKNGVYSNPAEGSVNFATPTLDVLNMSVVNLNSAYYIQYEMPDSRFIDHIEIYMDAEASSGNLSRTGATLIYSGNNTSYMYQIGASDLDKFHQFWVEVVES